MDNRPALGFGIGSSGSQRDTLGVLVISVSDSTPAAAAGLEEGNRIAAINGVNLRVAREDAGDDYMGNAKAQRLMREISQLAPGSDVTLRVYSDGRFRDVKMKVARAGDLPRRRSMMFLGGAGMMMPAMPAMPPMAPMAPMPPRAMEWPMSDMHFEIGPQIEAGLRQAGLELERIRPQLDRVLRDLPATLETIKLPRVQVDVDMQGEVLSLAPTRRAAPARVLTTVL
jgi:PDZ domain